MNRTVLLKALDVCIFTTEEKHPDFFKNMSRSTMDDETDDEEYFEFENDDLQDGGKLLETHAGAEQKFYKYMAKMFELMVKMKNDH